MYKKEVKYWLEYSCLSDTNGDYIRQLYKNFLLNPNLIDKSWHVFFEKIKLEENINHKKINYNLNSNFDVKQANIIQFINDFRCYGHQYANLDPLNMNKQKPTIDLSPSFYEFSKNDLEKTFKLKFNNINFNKMKLIDLYKFLKKTYCNSIGIEYMHIDNKKERLWIQECIESKLKKYEFKVEEKIKILKELTSAEGIEHYLGIKFPGAKRFSLEGGDVLIPMLREIIRHSSKNNIEEILIGMAHRGRLNVLVNVLGKNPKTLFDEFNNINKKINGTGDVKYHQGFCSDVNVKGKIIRLFLSFNPSHLEIVNPVVIGLTRSRIDQLKQNKKKSILSVVLHGDAAISGQGVVQETLNMSKTHGYDVGGTLRIVINNQIGFTTSNIQDSRSTNYCTDIAKMIQSPIFHVNADDPEASLFVIRVALDFINTFKRDVIIDLVCYRRHGHSEADEPSVTQPIMYKKIKKHLTVRKIYSDILKKERIVTDCDIKKMINFLRNKLDKGKNLYQESEKIDITNLYKSNKQGLIYNFNYFNKKNNTYLQDLAHKISIIPNKIKIQPLVAKVYQDRILMAKGKKPFDWGGAEILAYATLLDNGISVRLSGEDTARGTFFHRHAIIYDQDTASEYIPLSNIKNNQGNFYIYNSPLSEEAVLAFEYGYSIGSKSNTLVIWEAQFGDFANSAQVVIDQFICSGEQKWGQTSNLIMLLPHGYEGQGPEHSSSRLERYLQLCAEQNIKICIPSTPSQLYNMFIEHIINNIHKPLIVMSPKSLLRNPMSVSYLNEIINSKFKTVINEIDNFNIKEIIRIIICSGKIYYDLLSYRRKYKKQNIIIIRIEQLYPFPLKSIKKIFIKYSHIKDFVWCQEEPKNQGAWNYVKNYFRKIIPINSNITYSGRSSSAATATGYMKTHQIEQINLINDAFNIK